MLWLVILFILAGIGTAGTGLASSSIGLALAPRENSVAYLSVLSLTNAIASGTAPILAGGIASYLQHWNWTFSFPMNGHEMVFLSLQHWDFLFVFSFVLGLHALYRLHLIDEPGEVSGRMMVKVVIDNVVQVQKSSPHKIRFLKFPTSIYSAIAHPQEEKKAQKAA